MTVRWEAGAPATGWSWVKVSMEAAPSHAASSSTPSTSMGSDVLAAPISWAASPELHASASVAPRAVARRLQSDHRSSDATCRLHPVLSTRRRPKALSVSSIERWQYVWGLVEIPTLGECQILHRRKRQPDRQGHVLSLKTRLRTASQGTERSPGWTFFQLCQAVTNQVQLHSGAGISAGARLSQSSTTSSIRSCGGR